MGSRGPAGAFTEVPLTEQVSIQTLTIQMPAYARILATEVCAAAVKG